MKLERLLAGRVFCKKGCDYDGDTWEECSEECNELCYKSPVLKDHKWSAYIDRSPGAENYSEECFHACVSGCGFKFDIEPEKVDKVCPNRHPPPPPTPAEPPLPAVKSDQPKDNVPRSSA